MIVLRGDVDAAAVTRLDAHITGVRAVGARFLTIDAAAAVDSYDRALLDLLGRTQSRLGMSRGLLRVRGLHPSLLAVRPRTRPRRRARHAGQRSEHHPGDRRRGVAAGGPRS